MPKLTAITLGKLNHSSLKEVCDSVESHIERYCEMAGDFNLKYDFDVKKTTVSYELTKYLEEQEVKELINSCEQENPNFLFFYNI